jgi:hypothetical protein
VPASSTRPRRPVDTKDTITTCIAAAIVILISAAGGTRRWAMPSALNLAGVVATIAVGGVSIITGFSP